VAAPTALSEDEAAVIKALDEWAVLAASYPGHYYGLLAAARLQELSPERLAAIPDPRWHEVQGPWVVPAGFVESPEVLRGVALARLGLLGPAQSEWARIDTEVLDTGALGFLAAQTEGAGAFPEAHNLRRAFLLNAPGATLGPNRHQILRSAYASRWTAEVASAASGDGYDALLFQGLMREESGYNPRAKSHAGARGLAQLMPATGRSVADWMGMKITTAQLYDPVTNLTLGARYLDFLHDHFNGNSLLCLAGYNAGQGNVGKWLKAYGNLPTDEFVERIPFRETRKYVKAVSASWQIYRLLEPETQSVFPELSPFNHKAVPDTDPRPVADVGD
jgi:soluble lytic murein transglycosylase